MRFGSTRLVSAAFGIVVILAAGCTPTAAPNEQAQDETGEAQARPSEPGQGYDWEATRAPFEADVPETAIGGLVEMQGMTWVIVGSAAESRGAPRRPVAWTSTLGSVWRGPFNIDTDTGDGTVAHDVARLGGTLIAVGERRSSQLPAAAAWRSQDGQKWERIVLPEEVPNNSELHTVVANGDGALAVGHTGGLEPAPLVLRSRDGQSWGLVDVEGVDGFATVVSDAVLDGRAVLVGRAFRGLDQRPLAWVERGDGFALADMPSVQGGAQVASVTSHRGGLQAFGTKGFATSQALHWRSGNGGRSWKLLRGRGDYFGDPVSGSDNASGLELGPATSIGDLLLVAVSDGPAAIAHSPNGRRWNWFLAKHPKGRSYIPRFAAVAGDGEKITMAGDYAGGAFVWQFDRVKDRWQILDPAGEAFGRDQVMTELRAGLLLDEELVVGGSMFSPRRTGYRLPPLASRDAAGGWDSPDWSYPGEEAWVNFLGADEDTAIAAGGIYDGDTSRASVWRRVDDRWQPERDPAFTSSKASAGFVMAGAPAGDSFVLVGGETAGGVDRATAWVRNGSDWRRQNVEVPRKRVSAIRSVCTTPSAVVAVGSMAPQEAGPSVPVAWTGAIDSPERWRLRTGAFPNDVELAKCTTIGDQLVAVGAEGSRPAVWTSRDDGITWDGGAEVLPEEGRGHAMAVVTTGHRTVAAGQMWDGLSWRVVVWELVDNEWEVLPTETMENFGGDLTVREVLIEPTGAIVVVGSSEDIGTVWRGTPKP